MTLPLVFRRRFGRDLAGGFDWYEEQRSGLGEQFLSAVQSTLGSVEYQPEMFVSVHGGVRRAMVPRFPFAVFYLVESRRIVILRLLHTARDPRLCHDIMQGKSITGWSADVYESGLANLSASSWRES